MATAYIGQISPYVPADQRWDIYLEQVNNFFDANDVKDEKKKRAMLLTSIGTAAYTAIRSLTAPKTPAETDWKIILELLSKHYLPPVNPIIERRDFYQRFRKPGETVAIFLAELRSLASKCEFGDQLDTTLRDRVVCGIVDDRMQRRLLSEPYEGLTLARVVEICMAIETANKDVQRLHNETKGQEYVNAVASRKKLNDSVKSSVKGCCMRCGVSSHRSDECSFKTAECYKCGKTGHICRICKSKAKEQGNGHDYNKGRRKPVQYIEEPLGESAGESDSEPVFTIRPQKAEDDSELVRGSHSESVPPITETLRVNGRQVTFELDTGCGVSIMTAAAARSLFKDQITYQLHTFSGHDLPVLGKVHVTVNFRRKSHCLPLYIVSGSGPNLLGRCWMKILRISIPCINAINEAPLSLQYVLDRHAAVFQLGLGEFKGPKVHLSVKPDASPTFCKPRPVPYALRDKVNVEIDRLVMLGVFKPIDHSAWAAPLVPVLKADKQSIRLCGDYKVTINKACNVNQYPMPKAEDIFARMAGNKFFAKLDMSEAYAQLVLDEESQLLAAVNTPRGLMAVTRLPYGVASAPAIFQKTLDELLRVVPQAGVYIDDVILGGKTELELLHTLDTVLTLFEKAGFRLNRKKCQFLLTSVTYLGHVIDETGLHPTEDKTAAIRDAPTPTDVSQLRSFIGLISFYSKFVPNQATIMAPLYALLQNDTPWTWEAEQDRAFNDAKQALLNSQVLVHYNPALPVVVSCDASPWGIGAVLANVVDGEERPVCFLSRSLSPAEKSYSQLERESLSIIFALVRWRQYLLGRECTIVTDHRPLLSLLDPTKGLPPVAAARVMRWAMFLAGYGYKLRYRKGVDHGNADAMSRLPLPTTASNDLECPLDVVLFVDLPQPPLCTADKLRKATRQDPLLGKVTLCLQSGTWPKPLPEELMPFQRREEEMSVINGLVMWGQRVIIPASLRAKVKAELHDGHFGSQRMKALARSYVWWPNLDAELEALVAACTPCQQQARDPPKTAIHPWPMTNKPWSRLHVDYCGPVDGQSLLVVVDSYSRWIDAIPTISTTSRTTVRLLEQLFATHGFPEVIVSDNGTCFASAEFSVFCAANGIRHLRTAPYHPASNGLAERAVQTVKQGLKKNQGGDLQQRLARFLLSYRRTPQSTTNVSPAELLFKRVLRTRLDLVRPSLSNIVHAKQEKWPRVDARERPAPEVGSPMLARNYGAGDRWEPGVVTEHRSPHSLVVTSPTGGVSHRHPDQLRRSHVAGNSPPAIDDDDWLAPLPTAAVPQQPLPSLTPPVLRRSIRASHPPDRLTL